MIYILLFVLLTYLILTQSQISLYYALHGLTLWYQKMVPALLPFMILSGTLIRMNLTERFVRLFHPVIKRIFHCRPNVTYGIIMGFLCGFPMGAKIASDLLRSKKITEKEAEYLLGFCNNIGPVYFCSFIIPTLHIQNIGTTIFGMYGVPFIYGIILRYTRYKKDFSQIQNEVIQIGQPLELLTALDDSIRNSISSISMLCGYMVLFNLLNLVPHFFFPAVQQYLSPILEITGGIVLKTQHSPIYILMLLPFGGLSCIAQTNSMISDTSLSIRSYILHKIILTIITAVYYLGVTSFISL